MAEATLSIRIKAIDEATAVIHRVQKAGASAGRGMSGVAGFMQSPLGAGLAGGALGGGIMALSNAIMSMTTQIIDIAKKIFSTLVESSGYLQATMKIWNIAILEVFRPIGDMIGMSLLPSVQSLLGATTDSYATFLQNIRDGMSINEAMSIAMDSNTEALGTFLSGLIPVLENTINAMMPLVDMMVTKLTPVIADALVTIAPSIGAGIYKGLMEWQGQNLFGAAPDTGMKGFVEGGLQFGLPQILKSLGLEPNAGANALGVGGYAGPSSQLNVYGNVYSTQDLQTMMDQSQRNMTNVRVS